MLLVCVLLFTKVTFIVPSNCRTTVTGNVTRKYPVLLPNIIRIGCAEFKVLRRLSGTDQIWGSNLMVPNTMYLITEHFLRQALTKFMKKNLPWAQSFFNLHKLKAHSGPKLKRRKEAYYFLTIWNRLQISTIEQYRQKWLFKYPNSCTSVRRIALCCALTFPLPGTFCGKVTLESTGSSPSLSEP